MDQNEPTDNVIVSQIIINRLRLAFWIVEVIKLITCFIILTIAGTAAAGMKELGFPHMTTGLAYNIAIVRP
jgi:hypothetical protein